jgi:Domain of Unknown Function (DUF1206)
MTVSNARGDGHDLRIGPVVVLLLAVAVGLVAYGLYSFVEARFRRV